jgi:hypothetical protein
MDRGADFVSLTVDVVLLKPHLGVRGRAVKIMLMLRYKALLRNRISMADKSERY